MWCVLAHGIKWYLTVGLLWCSMVSMASAQATTKTETTVTLTLSEREARLLWHILNTVSPLTSGVQALNQIEYNIWDALDDAMEAGDWQDGLDSLL